MEFLYFSIDKNFNSLQLICPIEVNAISERISHYFDQNNYLGNLTIRSKNSFTYKHPTLLPTKTDVSC